MGLMQIIVANLSLSLMSLGGQKSILGARGGQPFDPLPLCPLLRNLLPPSTEEKHTGNSQGRTGRHEDATAAVAEGRSHKRGFAAAVADAAAAVLHHVFAAAIVDAADKCSSVFQKK